MASVHPIAIQGNWRAGFSLDRHIVSSTYLGDDEYGHPVFDTVRTEIGELLFRLKYRSDSSVVSEIAETTAAFVRNWNPGVTAIVPVPPSKANRPKQPVFLLAEAIGEKLSIPVRTGCVSRKKDIPELKNVYDYTERLKLLKDAHIIDPSVIAGQSVLLFDDVYRSGASMNAVAELLKQHSEVNEVFALTLTLTQKR